MKSKYKASIQKTYLAPFKYLRPSIRSESSFCLALLLMQVLMLVLTKSFRSLLVLFAAVLATTIVDLVDMKFDRKTAYTWVTTLTKGCLIGLLLPSTYPPIAVFSVTAIIAILDRIMLGGFANSWINPAAITVATCWIIGMNFFPLQEITVAELQNRNPALTLIQNGTFQIGPYDAKITNFLNRRVFSLFKVSIPDGYVSLLWDSHSTIPAFRFNFLTIISSIVILSADLISPIIPFSYIAVYALLVKFLAPIFYNGTFMQGDVILALFTSGTLFCTFFMLQWPGTTPFMNRGKLTYGIIAGIIAFFMVGCGLSPSGTVFTILIINIISLLIQSYENKISEKYAETVLKRKIKSVKEGTHA